MTRKETKLKEKNDKKRNEISKKNLKHFLKLFCKKKKKKN